MNFIVFRYTYNISSVFNIMSYEWRWGTAAER